MHPAMGSHLSKYKKLVPAIALITHVAARDTGPISSVAVNRAIKWAEFLEKHAWRAYASANVVNANAAHAILRGMWTGRLKTTFTAREVQRANLLGLDNTDTIRNALELLIDHNWLTFEKVPTGNRGGRPSETYTLSSHPKATRSPAGFVDGLAAPARLVPSDPPKVDQLNDTQRRARRILQRDAPVNWSLSLAHHSAMALMSTRLSVQLLTAARNAHHDS
jgi:hypothetical protein